MYDLNDKLSIEKLADLKCILESFHAVYSLPRTKE